MSKQVKTLFLLLLLTLTNTLYGSSELLNIKNLSVQYDGKIGSANFTDLAVKTHFLEFQASQYYFDIEKKEDSISILWPDNKLTLKTVEGDLLSNLGIVQLEGLNLEIIKNDQFSLSLEKAIFEIGNGLQEIKKLDLKCKSGSNRNGDIFSFLLPCLKYSVFYMPKIILPKEAQGSVAKAFDIESFNLLYKEKGHRVSEKGLIPNELKNVLINISNNRFSLKAKIKILFNLKVKGQGTIHFHQQSSEVEVKLKKIKIGIIGIKKAVLKAIRESNLSNVRVVGESIFIKV